MSLLFFFFFQAEDGIRDLYVTGVQTCALPISNVLFGAFGQVASGVAAATAGGDRGSVRSASADDVAVMLAYAQKVVFVPGYGMAVAQAQHDVRALADLLEEKGIEVTYAIHPVAG